ncbi:MAG TPA: cell division protein CrgA [Acidimicrobiales bacterium]|nr:cell division protein CrgA [Acidimicrobiales bacterium]
MAKANTGPGRAQGKGRSAEGRATAKPGTEGAAKAAPSKSSSGKGTSRVGRYTPAVESGRYTPPIPRSVRRSPRWMGILILVLLLGGILVVLLNYLLVLPGSASAWYLVLGLAMMFVGFMLATRYR